MSTWDPADDEAPPRRKLPLGLVAALIAVGIGGGAIALIAILASGNSERAAQKEPAPAANERLARHESDVDRAPERAPDRASDDDRPPQNRAAADGAADPQADENRREQGGATKAERATEAPPSEPNAMNRSTPAAPPSGPALQFAKVDLQEIRKAYEGNQAAADAKYLDKPVEFTFRPQAIDKDESGVYYAWSNIFNLDDSSGRGRHTRCYFRPGVAATLGELRRGQQLTLRGVCSGKTGTQHTFHEGFNGGGSWGDEPVISFRDCEIVDSGGGRNALASDDPHRRRGGAPAKPPQTNLEQQTVLELAEVIRDEMARVNAAAAAWRRDPAFNPSDRGQQIPDPHAKTRALFDRQAEERAALSNRTVEGKAKFLGAQHDRVGRIWLVTLQVRVSGSPVKVQAFASDEQVAVLKKWKVGDTILVQGKITNRSFSPPYEHRAFGDAQLHIYNCTFNSP
jgi:hypothetical protein